jgi:hypothetical protein
VSDQPLTPEMEALTRHLLGPCPTGGYPLPILAIATTVLKEMGIPASTQRCLLIVQKDSWQSDFDVDAMQINGVVCRFKPNTITYGWEDLIDEDLRDLGGVSSHEITRIFNHSLNSLLAEHRNMADPTYLEDFLDETRSKAQHWELSKRTPDELPRTRRIGL